MSTQAVEMNQSSSSGSGNTESRNALAFRIPDEDENSPKQEQMEEDDSFYDLTVNELRSIYSDLEKRKEINDKLLPRSKREEEESKLMPHKYEYQNTVIRIEFPDRMVLQGEFKINETVSEVKEFVRDHIREPGAGFDLFTSPPKTILAESARLIDLKLVPTAKIYIGIQNGGNCQLVSERPAVVPYSCAQEAVTNFKRTIEQASKPGPSKTPVVQSQESDSGSASKKVPKWFKMKK